MSISSYHSWKLFLQGSLPTPDTTYTHGMSDDRLICSMGTAKWSHNKVIYHIGNRTIHGRTVIIAEVDTQTDLGGI